MMMFWPMRHGDRYVAGCMWLWRTIHRPGEKMTVPDLKTYLKTRRVRGSRRRGRRASWLWASAMLVKFAPTGGVAR